MALGGFLFGPPEAGSKVGTVSRPDTIWRIAARRGGHRAIQFWHIGLCVSGGGVT